MKVLCAVDGSQFAEWGVEAVGALLGNHLARLVLLHVIDSAPAGGSKGLRRRGKHVLSIAEKEADRLLRHTSRLAETARGRVLASARMHLRLLVAHGPVAESILRQANRERADLIVIGTRGVSDIRGFLLGSVARKVVSLASRPVLVVKRAIRELKHAVVAVDGSRQADGACRFLGRHVLPARVTILTVVPSVMSDLAASVLPLTELTRLSRPQEEAARQLTERYRSGFLREGFEVDTQVLSGHPVIGILQFLERTRADLAAVGSRGLTGTERLVLGSVSEGVLQHAPCSVLVVPGIRKSVMHQP
jgi:nucleotide-binding universal stress UspA family protein